MSSQTVTTANKILNELVAKRGLGDIINRTTSPTLAFLKKKDATETMGGRYVRIPVIVEGNYGYAARGDDSDSPTAGYENVQEAQAPLRFFRGQISLTQGVMWAAEKDKNALIDPIELETKGLLKTAQMYHGRTLYNDGTPAYGLTNGAQGGGGGTTVTFDGLTGYKTLRNGMRIDIYADNTYASKEVDSRSISSVAYSDSTGRAGTFTISGAAATWSNNALIVPEDSVVSAASVDWVGLTAAVAAAGSTYMGLSGTTYSDWQSTVLDGTTINGGSPTDAHFQNVISTIDMERGQTGSFTIFTTHRVRDLFANSQLSMKVYNDTGIEAGYKYINFTAGGGTIKMLSDKYVPAGYAFVIDTDECALFRLHDFDWTRGPDGSVLHWQQGTDKFVAQMSYGATFGLLTRNSHGVITGLTETFA